MPTNAQDDNDHHNMHTTQQNSSANAIKDKIKKFKTK